jgi:putative transposase
MHKNDFGARVSGYRDPVVRAYAACVRMPPYTPIQRAPMPRLARFVIPGIAHHITQRGNGRQQVFFAATDYAMYLRLLRHQCHKLGITCLAYCLMPNHVHLILVPSKADDLRRCLASVHRSYAGRLNERRDRSGHFWQGRYGSVAMDDAHLYEALRYVLLNPVRAQLAARAELWRWSSARAYVAGVDDGLTAPAAMRAVIPDVRAYLSAPVNDDGVARLRSSQATGRPLGSDQFALALEATTGRRVRRLRAGRKPRPAVRREQLAQ